MADAGWSSEIQPQFWVSIARLAAAACGSGAMWLLWNSNILTDRKRHAALVAGLVYGLFSVSADLGLVFAGKYKYAFDEMLYMGVPLDLHFVYACLWGTGLCLAWEMSWLLMRPVVFIAAVSLGVVWDQWGLKSGHLFIAPSSDWQMWDIIVRTALCFICVCFFRLVEENRAIMLRSTIYALGYFAVFYFLIPSIVLSSCMGQPLFPAGQWREAALLLGLVSLPGAWAAGQFATSGRGTPLPLDPTQKLIVTGPYAYVRNPMQISLVGVSAIWAYTTRSFALGGYVVLLLLAMHLFRVYEEDGLHRRFGARYKKYSRKVWLWLPKLIPYDDE